MCNKIERTVLTDEIRKTVKIEMKYSSSTKSGIIIVIIIIVLLLKLEYFFPCLKISLAIYHIDKIRKTVKIQMKYSSRRSGNMPNHYHSSTPETGICLLYSADFIGNISHR